MIEVVVLIVGLCGVREQRKKFTLGEPRAGGTSTVETVKTMVRDWTGVPRLHFFMEEMNPARRIGPGRGQGIAEGASKWSWVPKGSVL